MSNTLRKTLKVTKFLTAVIATAAAAMAFAGEDLGFGDDEGPNSEFYSQAYQDKLRSNNQIARTLSLKAKALVTAAQKAHTPKKLALYSDFKNRLEETVLNSRKSSQHRCQRLALKFKKLDTRASTIANCRTDLEVQLERRLQALELEFKRIAD